MKTKTTHSTRPKPSRQAKKQKSTAFFKAQPKVAVGRPDSRFETEADQMAERAVHGKGTTQPLFGQITPLVQTKPEELQAKAAPEEETMVQRQEEEEVQTKVEEEELQMQAEEEPVQAKEEEEEVQAKMEEKEPVQTKAEEEEAVQAKEEEEEAMQTKMEEKERAVQKKEEEPVQTKEEEEPVQAKRSPRKLLHRGLDLAGNLRLRRGKGNPLEGTARQKMEQAFQADFSEVRIHTDQDAIRMNQALGAQAFANGSDVFFNQGKFDPSSSKGQLLLAHELTHTIQQGAVKPADKADPAPPVDASSVADQVTDTSATPLTDATTAQPGDTSSELSTTTVPDTVADGDVAAGEPAPEETAVPRSPQEDPNFQNLKKDTAKVAKGQKTTPTADSLAGNAQEAAPLADNEQMGEAQSDQVEEMDKEKPQEFDAATFKKLLLEQIAKVLPKNEEEADQFPESGKMDTVKDNAGQQVAVEKEQAGGAISKATSKEPDPNQVTPRAVADLSPPEVGRAPKSLEAGKVTPPVRNDSEVKQPLVDNAKEMDDEMANAGVTDEQLAKSEEPTFLAGLDEKKTAKAHTETAPTGLRTEEQQVREKHEKKAESIGDDKTAAMFGGRKDLLAKATGNQKDSAKDHTSAREKISQDIDGIFAKTKDDVEKVLGTADGSKEGTIDEGVNTKFDLYSKLATLRFESFIRRKMDAYKRERYGSWFDPRGWGKRIKDTFAGMPKEVDQFYVDGRKKYLEDMDVALTLIARYIATELGKVKVRIAKGRQEVKDYVAGLSKSQQKLAKDAVTAIEDKFSELDDAVSSKQDALIDTIAQKYKESLEAVDARIEEMKAANRGLIDKALDAIKGIIETIRKLKQLINDLLAAIASLIDVIMEDPIGFMKSLFAGIKAGFDSFVENIKKHLIGGFLKWLTGSLGPMGITVPENIFSLSGIFSLVMQVLGLGWDFVRKKMVRLLTEPVVRVVEKGFTVIKVIKEKGVMGLWEEVKQQFTDLKATVIDAIQNMVITQVIQAGIKWLLSLLIPGAGFIKAIIAIKDFIVFFVESAIALIPTLIEAIKAAAAKNFSRIGKAVEAGLATLIPLLIGLLAKLLGISGLVKKVQKIIKNIRKRIDRAVNKLILKAKNWARKFVKGAKKKGKKIKDKLVQWWKKKKDFKTKNGKSHSLTFKGKGKKAKLEARSKVFGVIPVSDLKRKLSNVKKGITDQQKNELITEATSLETLLDKKETETKAESIQKSLNKIAGILKATNILDDTSQPPSKVTWKMDKGRAGKVEANPLTEQPGNTQGAAAQNAVLEPVWGFVTHYLNIPNKPTKSGGTIKKFVLVSADHLLNARYHGPSTNWNLAVALDPINSTMQAGENKVTKEMLENEQLKYTGTAQYFSNSKPSVNLSDRTLSYEKAKPALEFYVAKSITLTIEKWNEKKKSFDKVLAPTKYGVDKFPDQGKGVIRKEVELSLVKATLKSKLVQGEDALVVIGGKKYRRTASRSDIALELRNTLGDKLDEYNTINAASLKNGYDQLVKSQDIIILTGQQGGTYLPE